LIKNSLTTIGKNIDKALDYIGWTIEQLALESKISKKTILSWMHDPNVRPHPPNLRAVANVLSAEIGRRLLPGELKDPNFEITKLPVNQQHKR